MFSKGFIVILVFRFCFLCVIGTVAVVEHQQNN